MHSLNEIYQNGGSSTYFTPNPLQLIEFHFYLNKIAYCIVSVITVLHGSG